MKVLLRGAAVCLAVGTCVLLLTGWGAHRYRQSEGALLALRVGALAAFTGGDPAAPRAANAGERESGEETEARQRVWWPLLLAALLLFAAEAVLARRTKMVKMIG